MPGITGIISKVPQERYEIFLEQLIERLLHESFYTVGKYVNKELGIYVGSASLKGSFSDCMPVWNEKKDIALIFLGETFADKHLFDHLKSKHHTFNKYNASYLIHLYEEMGMDFLKELNGWFSGLLIDLRKEKAVLFNDRYGMQRLYYHQNKDAFFFSSEAKCLLSVCPELREIDTKSLAEFFSFNCVLDHRTLFHNIFVLPGGAAWTFHKNSEVKKDIYFSRDFWENQPWLEKDFFYDRLKETFGKILPRYFRAEQRIGMSLTGGLDTRMIMANVNKSPGELPCYTYGGMYRDCFDIKVARKVADTCHQPHQVLSLDKQFLNDFPKHAEETIYITDGCLDVCVSHEVYLSRLAAEIAPIRMTGNYGSEVFRSVNYIKASPPLKELFHPDFNECISDAVRAFSESAKGHQLSYAVFNLIPRHLYGRLIAARSQLTLRTPYLDNDLVSLMYQAPPDVRKTREISLRLIADGNPELGALTTDRGVGGNSNILFSKIARLYYEFLFKAEYAYNEGMPQWLAGLDFILSPFHLERLFLGRHKIEHYRVWFRNELARYIREILLDKRTAARPYLNGSYLEEIVRDHIKGSRNYTKEINLMLTAELIQRLLVEQTL